MSLQPSAWQLVAEGSGGQEAGLAEREPPARRKILQRFWDCTSRHAVWRQERAMKAGFICSRSAQARSCWSGFWCGIMVELTSGMLWPVGAVKGRDPGSQETPVCVCSENPPRRKGYLANIPIPWKFSLFHPFFLPSFLLCRYYWVRAFSFYWGAFCLAAWGQLRWLFALEETLRLSACLTVLGEV